MDFSLWEFVAHRLDIWLILLLWKEKGRCFRVSDLSTSLSLFYQFFFKKNQVNTYININIFIFIFFLLNGECNFWRLTIQICLLEERVNSCYRRFTHKRELLFVKLNISIFHRSKVPNSQISHISNYLQLIYSWHMCLITFNFTPQELYKPLNSWCSENP